MRGSAGVCTVARGHARRGKGVRGKARACAGVCMRAGGVARPCLGVGTGTGVD